MQGTKKTACEILLHRLWPVPSIPPFHWSPPQGLGMGGNKEVPEVQNSDEQRDVDRECDLAGFR